MNPTDEIGSKFKSMRAVSAAVLAVDLLFVAEFQFIMTNNLHLWALALFSLSIPVFTTNVYSSFLWDIGNRFESCEGNVDFGIATSLTMFLTPIAVGLCIWSYSHLAGIAYLVGCGYFVFVIGRLHGIYTESKRITDKFFE